MDRKDILEQVTPQERIILKHSRYFEKVQTNELPNIDRLLDQRELLKGIIDRATAKNRVANQTIYIELAAVEILLRIKAQQL